tara:strand:- start:2773 stop:5313 length:2541 start_codon:yes stop_codon:yes gene_type:complete
MKTNLSSKTTSTSFKDNAIAAIAEEIIIIIEVEVKTVGSQSKMLILSISKAACNLLQYDKEELIGLPIEDIFVEPNDAESLLKESLDCGVVCAKKKALKTKLGEKVYVLFSCCVKCDKENTVKEILLLGQNITDQKEAEETLAKQSKLLQSVLKNMADGVVLIDTKGRLIDFNPAAERILRLDLTQKDVLSKRDGFFLPDKKTPFPNEKRPLIRAINGEDVNKCEVFVKHERLPDGIFISINARPLRNHRGEITGGVAVFDDITENKLASESLRESEERFRALLDGTFEGILIYDKGKIMAVNNAAAELFGFDVEQMKGMNIIDLLVDECKAEIAEKLTLVEKDPDVNFGKFETKVRGKNKEVFNIKVYGRSLVFQGKKVRVVAIRDITRQKKAEKELQYRMDLENLITNISTSFINLTPDEIECGISSALKKIGEFAGVDRSYIFLFTEDGKKINNSYEWCAESDCIKPHMRHAQQIDLSKFPWFYKKIAGFEQVYVPSLDKLPEEAKIERMHLEQEGVLSLLIIPMVYGKSLKGFLGFNAMRTQKEWCEDIFVLLKITGEIFVNALEHKKMLNAIKKAKEDLEQKVEERTKELKEKQVQLINSEKMVSLGQLVAGVAHEINTPLGALSSNNDIFIRSIEKMKGIIPHLKNQDNELDYSDFDKLIKRIEELNHLSKMAAERIISIVNNLRKFARLDQAVKDRVDIHSGIESTLTLVQHELKNRVKVHKEYGKLPPVSCYPNQLNQVFMNIFINASQSIEGKGDIYVKTRVHNGDALVEIQDNGKGIPKRYLNKIFNPGFTTKGVGIGTGLGLSIVYQIIKDHNGKIEVTSDVGKGTKVIISLPIK